MIFAANNSNSSGGSSAFTFIILAVLIGLFYLLIMRPQRNRQRKAMQTQSQVMPGQRIRTTAGLYGTVVSGDDRDIVVEIAPGVEVTMLRRAIMEVIPDDSMPSHEDIEPEEPGEPEDEHEAEAETEAHDDAPPTDLKKDRNV
jgi:preprotein translocase subunit YajC